MYTCRKVYRDIPFAHRQHRHDGQCALIHGHNWSFTFVFGCRELDSCGFVVDFGKLRFVRQWLEDHLDHACLFNHDDPYAAALMEVGGESVWKVLRVPCCSCEGVARYVFDAVDPLVRQATEGRAFLVALEVHEDSRNAAEYHPCMPDTL